MSEEMVTYTATHQMVPRTLAYCSDICRAKSLGFTFDLFDLRDDDSYEFDETCANCGSLIKASK